MQKSVWIFGIIAGAFSAYMEYMYFSGSDVSLTATYISKILATIICVAFALVLLKKVLGEMSIARTIFSGVLVAVTSVMRYEESMMIIFLTHSNVKNNVVHLIKKP